MNFSLGLDLRHVMRRYAHRAKNIRNTPQINQRTTKRALLKDFAQQIESLKLELQVGWCAPYVGSKPSERFSDN